MRVNRGMRLRWRRLIGHLGTLLLSIIMGLIVWLIAINQENPLITRTFGERIPIEIRNKAHNLSPAQDLSRASVQVVLQAPRTVWDRLQPSQVKAYVDLEGLGKGSHNVPVQVSVASSEVTVKSRDPAQWPIQLDEVVTKTVPVRVTIMDNTAFGYDWQTPIINPLTVNLEGPASQVEQVVVADAPVFMRGANAQVVRLQAVDLLDAQNRAVSLVESIPPTVEVVVPVERWPGRKEVAVRVDLEGQPASGFRLGPLLVDPTMVVLRGNSDTLNGIGFVETEPVTIDGATGDLRARPRLLLPNDVTAFEGDVVDVLVSIVPVEDSTRITLRPTVRGLGTGLSATVALDTVDVIVSGPKSILDALESDDIFVILNLSNRLPGSHVITPEVVIPDGIRKEGVLPETVEVIIASAPISSGGAPVTVTESAAVTTTITPTISVENRATPPAAGQESE